MYAVLQGFARAGELRRILDGGLVRSVYGQGRLFGRPGPLPARTAGAARLGDPAPRPASVATGAYHAVAARQRPRRGTKRLLLAISRHLEEQVQAQGAAAIVLAAFQEARHFTAATAARYERLARHAAFVGALGAGLDAAPAPGVRGEHLTSGDPLGDEWNVVVVAPHFAAAVVARDLGDPPAGDMDRRFDFCLTYDRGLAIEAATTLLGRIAPLPG